MMNIRLIALDLDGTTLNDDKKLTAATKASLEGAIKRDVHVVIATGRTFSAIPDELKNIRGIRYLICSNGAEIYDLQNGGLIYSNYLESHSIEVFTELMAGTEHMIEIFTEGKAYADELHYNMALDGSLTYRNREYIISTRKPLKDVFSFLLEYKSRIENINVNFEHMEDKRTLWDYLSKIPDVTLTSSFDHNIELGGKTTSKAEALHHLAEILGVKAEEMMAFGDSPNDWAMMSLCGYPVAVANAKEEIRKQAYYVTASNNEDGVAKAIERFILNESVDG